MKIVQMSTYNADGGAARAAYRLHKGAVYAGHESTMLVRRQMGSDPTVKAFSTEWNWAQRFFGVLRAKHVQHDHERAFGDQLSQSFFSDDRSRFKLAFKQSIPSCDIINLHWVADDFLDYEGFLESVNPAVPVVWTLHDMNPFTGGCHYDAGCGRYREKCGACPMLTTKSKVESRNIEMETGDREQAWDQEPRAKDEKGIENDLSRQIWLRKKKAFDKAIARGVKLHIVSPSTWLADCARQSSLFGVLDVSVIPYGLDTEVFKPMNPIGMREALGFSPDEFVVLFVAHCVSHRRKGMKLLLRALKQLDCDSLKLRVLCIGEAGLEGNSFGLPISYTGTIKDDRMLALRYSAADCFVIPSLEDNLPNTVLESMACGTPVIGFNAGGIPDMVRHEDTGLLVPVGDVSALASAVTRLVSDLKLRISLAKRCREVALAEYTLDIQAQRYIKLYQGLLGKK